jgi:hypothetical protein
LVSIQSLTQHLENQINQSSSKRRQEENDMRDQFVINVNPSLSLPQLNNARLLHPEMQDQFEEVIDSRYLKGYWPLTKGYKKVWVVYRELVERGFLCKTLGLREGKAIYDQGIEFFAQHFGRDFNSVYLWKSVMEDDEGIFVPNMYINCCGEFRFAWGNIEDHRYVMEDFHYIYDKEGTYEYPSVHEMLS